MLRKSGTLSDVARSVMEYVSYSIDALKATVTAQVRQVGSVSVVGSLRGIWECVGSQRA